MRLTIAVMQSARGETSRLYRRLQSGNRDPRVDGSVNGVADETERPRFHDHELLAEGGADTTSTMGFELVADGGDPRLVTVHKVDRNGILVDCSCLVLLRPDPDQVARQLVSLRQTVRGLCTQNSSVACSSNPLLWDRCFAMGIHSSESPAPRSIQIRLPVRLQVRTPLPETDSLLTACSATVSSS